MDRPPATAATIRGRGAATNPAGRFETRACLADDALDPALEPDPRTTVSPDHARSVLSTNDSPDIPFDQSLNPYRGCEHGCIYCYARPSHGYLGLSAGLDFETRLYYKVGAASLLERQLSRPGYVVRPVTLGSNTDPYQPAERRYCVTRGVLEVFARTRHPVRILTKGALILRDADLLADLARDRLVEVMVSLTTLDEETKRTLEPRASSGRARLRAIEGLAARGVPVGVLVAPLIPAVNDHELEAILAAAAAAGAASAGYIPLRLPYEVKDLFRDWLERHRPDSARRVMALVRDMRGGRDNDPRFGTRMSGTGPVAALVRQRFERACREHGLRIGAARDGVRTDLFRPPSGGPQLTLSF